jgi:hypothetical protein
MDSAEPQTRRQKIHCKPELIINSLQRFYATCPALAKVMPYLVGEATISLRSEYANELKEAEKDLQSIPGWGQLTAEERANSAAAIHQLELEPGEDLQALDRLVAKGYDINKAVSATRQMVEQTGLERVRQREETLRAQSGGGAKRLSETIKTPKVIRSASELGALIDQMNELKARAALYEDIELTISTESGA